MSHFIFVLTLTISTALIVNNFALAQDSSELEELTIIGTRIEESVQEIAANVSVLHASELGTLAPVHIQQALNRVPGVSTQRGNGQESLPGIRSAVLTGAGACGSVLVLEEAIAVRGNGFCNVNELFDTHFEQASQIEVVRGPNTAFYGSNALNGSININLPSIGQDSVSAEFGSDSFIRLKGAVSYAKENDNQGRVYLTISDDGGFRDESGYEQQKFSWRHRAQLNNWNIQAGLTYTNLDQETAGFIVGLDSYRDRSLARQNPTPEAFRKTRSLRTWLKGSRTIGQTSDFTGTVYLRDTEMDFLQHFLPGDPLEQNEQSGIGFQTALYFNPTDQLSWAIGIDAEITDAELTQTQDLPTVGSNFLVETIPTGTHYDYQVDSEQIAIFTHANWQFTDSWEIITGVRLESIFYDYDNLTLDGRTRDDSSECGFGGCRYNRPADQKDRFTHISPKVELRYRPSEQWRLSITLADAFRAPQATELYRLQGEQTTTDLDIVENSSIELAAKYVSEKLEFSGSLYYSESDNLIIRDSDSFNIDGQSTSSEGLELSAQYTLSESIKWRAVTSIADHQYTSEQIVDGSNINGNQVDTAPKVFGSIFFDWAPNSRFSTELELQHVGSYYLDPSNEHKYPGHTLLNARARFELNEQWRVSIRGINLSNRAYADRADFTTFTDERYFPGAPRSAFVELNYQF